MAFSSGNDSGGPMASINVTPLVDVMLVLLIIFMVTAPIQTYPIDVTLPQPTVNPPPVRADPPPLESVVKAISESPGGYGRCGVATKPTLRMPCFWAMSTSSRRTWYLVVLSPRTLSCGCGDC